MTIFNKQNAQIGLGIALVVYPEPVTTATGLALIGAELLDKDDKD